MGYCLQLRMNYKIKKNTNIHSCWNNSTFRFVLSIISCADYIHTLVHEDCYILYDFEYRNFVNVIYVMFSISRINLATHESVPHVQNHQCKCAVLYSPAAVSSFGLQLISNHCNVTTQARIFTCSKLFRVSTIFHTTLQQNLCSRNMHNFCQRYLILTILVPDNKMLLEQSFIHRK